MRFNTPVAFIWLAASLFSFGVSTGAYGSSDQPQPEPGANGNILDGSCGQGLLHVLRTSTDLSALFQLSPQSNQPVPNEAAPNETDWGPAWLQQLMYLLRPLRSGGTVVELLQSSFFHHALTDQAIEAGWQWDGRERFSRFFSKLSPDRQVQFLRALSVRLWLYTRRDPDALRSWGVVATQLKRFGDVLLHFLASNNDDLLKQFLARILFESNQTDADVHRIVGSAEFPYRPEVPRVLVSDNRLPLSVITNAAMQIANAGQGLEPHYPFLYWMRMHLNTGAAFQQTVLGIADATLGERSRAEASSAVPFGQATAAYTEELRRAALTMQIQNLRWRLAMSRITNPHEVVENLRRHITETIQSWEQGTNAATRLIAALGNIALRYLGLGWLGYSLNPGDVAGVGSNFYGYLPENWRTLIDSLYTALDELEEQLRDWASQVAAIGDATEIEAELARLQAQQNSTAAPPNGR